MKEKIREGACTENWLKRFDWPPKSGKLLRLRYSLTLPSFSCQAFQAGIDRNLVRLKPPQRKEFRMARASLNSLSEENSPICPLTMNM
jgi:hypothetical protein